MSLLTIRCHKHFIYVIIFWILEITLRLMLYLKLDFFTFTKDTEDIIKNEYMYVIFLNVADLLSGFLVLYANQSSKTKKKNIEKIYYLPKIQKTNLSMRSLVKLLKKIFI